MFTVSNAPVQARVARPAATGCRSASSAIRVLTTFSALQNLPVEPSKPFRIGGKVNRDDLSVRDRKTECYTRLSALSPNKSRDAFDQSHLCGAGTSRQDLRHFRGAADFCRCAHLHCCAIGSEDDVRVEQREQRGEVTAARGCKKGFHDFPLTTGVGGRPSRSLHSAACAAGELACWRRGAS